MESIGERIKNKRKELGLTQLELAEKIGVTDKAVSKWEQGEGDPSIAILPELAKIFDVTLDYLMTGKVVENISLDDMDSNKRLEYLIKKDDVDNYKKYGYTIKKKETIDFQYDYPLNGPWRESYHKFDIKQISAIIEAKAEKIFDYACDEICGEYKVVSLAGLFGNILDDVVKMAVDIDRADVLKVVGINYLSIKDDQKDDRNMKNQTYVLPFMIINLHGYGLLEYARLAETLSIRQETFDYIFENRNKAPKSYELVMNLEITFNVQNIFNIQNINFYVYNGNRPYVLLDRAVKFSDYKFIETFFNIAKEQFEKTDFSTRGDSYYSNKVRYDMNTGYLYNENSIISRLFCMPKSLIYYLIDNQKEDLAKEMMQFNANLTTALNKKLFLTDEKNKLSFFSMTIAELRRYKELNNKNLSEKDRDLIESVNNHIVVPNYLLRKNDLKFIRKILDENYYHPYEMAYKCLYDKKEKELFKYFMDTENEQLADLLLKGKDCYNELLFEVMQTYKNAPNDLNLDKELEKFVSKKSNDFMDKNNPIIKHIENLKNEIYENVNKRLLEEKKLEEERKERARIVKGLTKDYFQDLLDKSETEMFIIKLSSLLDAILKFDYRYEQEDFAGRMNAYFKFVESTLPKSRNIDDGWGYIVLDSQYEGEVVKPAREEFERKSNLLNRLRMLRNNIAHSESKKVKELSSDELQECMNIVCAMNKEEK